MEEKKVAPHLPKEVRQKGSEAIARENWFLQLFLLAVIFGFVSGVVGGMVINTRFFDDWLWGQGNLGNPATTSSKIESGNLSYEDLKRESFSAVFDFYPEVALNKDGFLDPSFKIGSGFFLTSNGYAAASKTVLEKFNRKDLIAIDQDKKVYTLEKIVGDPISDLAIVKINHDGAGTLSFATEEDIYSDLDVWLPFLTSGLYQTKVLDADYWFPRTHVDYYLNSEKIYRLGLIKNSIDKKNSGLPVVNSRGQTIGMLLASDSNTTFNPFIKSTVIASALKQVLETGSIKRNYLGLQYEEVGEATNNKSSNRNGIILTNNPFTGASFMDKKSPLFSAGLKVGDIILNLNDEVISPVRSLPEILLDYSPGSKVKIKYSHEGTEKNVEIILGQISSK